MHIPSASVAVLRLMDCQNCSDSAQDGIACLNLGMRIQFFNLGQQVNLLAALAVKPAFNRPFGHFSSPKACNALTGQRNVSLGIYIEAPELVTVVVSYL